MKNLLSTYKAQLTKILSAFTLAETLIVIGIIGVVAALTLPNLNHATGDKEKITRVKKIYSSLTDAFDRAQVIYGPCDEWWKDTDSDTDEADILALSRISEFLKITKISDDKLELYLSDGMSITSYRMNYDRCGSSNYHKGEVYQGSFIVDIDGPNKGKNEYGNDIFRFDITDKNIYPEDLIYFNSDDDGNFEKLKYCCFSQGYCTQWIINNDNMDYLKADKTGKCPDGTQLSWTVTSCN